VQPYDRVITAVANSTVTGNTAGWAALIGGVIASYGDNYIDGNVASSTGSLTPIAKQ
jgi:F0F1-type ATP synthase delta subunit